MSWTVNARPFYVSLIACALLTLCVSTTSAQPAPAAPPSVYTDAADPLSVRDDAVNRGGANFDFTFRYLTDYVYRGIDKNESGGKEDAANVQFDASMSFDLGKAPHPYIGVFSNIYDEDPISRFQEIRPYIGASWTIRPLTITAGNNTYLFLEREEANTSEFFVRFQIDDNFWLKQDKALFSPYVMGAYDYDENKGWYFEAGIERSFMFEDLGLKVTAYADVAYVTTYQLYAVEPGGQDSGFQHYDVGMMLQYNLNRATSLPPRYGTWFLEGYLVYTDGLDNDLKADTQLWGGLGLRMKY